jgi:hypothetical protein
MTMEMQQSEIILQIEKRVLVLRSKINTFFENLKTPYAILAKGEFVNEYQKEFQEIETLNYIINLLKRGDNIEKIRETIGKQIISESLNNSTSPSANVVGLYRFNGKREVINFLNTLK